MSGEKAAQAVIFRAVSAWLRVDVRVQDADEELYRNVATFQREYADKLTAKADALLASLNVKKKAPDLTGQRFGRLLVLGRDERPKSKRFFVCRCDCGKETVARNDRLTGGTTSSCGCYRRDVAAARARKRFRVQPPVLP
jgi:hypothetical protein